MSERVKSLCNTMLKDRNTDKCFWIIRQIRKDIFKDDLKAVQEYQKLIHADKVKQIGEFYIFVRDVDDVEFEEIFEEDEEE